MNELFEPINEHFVPLIYNNNKIQINKMIKNLNYDDLDWGYLIGESVRVHNID